MDRGHRDDGDGHREPERDAPVPGDELPLDQAAQPLRHLKRRGHGPVRDETNHLAGTVPVHPPRRIISRGKRAGQVEIQA